MHTFLFIMSTYLSPVFPGVAKVTKGILVTLGLVLHGSCQEQTGSLHIAIIVCPLPRYVAMGRQRLEATFSGVACKTRRARIKDLVVHIRYNCSVQFRSRRDTYDGSRVDDSDLHLPRLNACGGMTQGAVAVLVRHKALYIRHWSRQVPV